ncbi:hypothetical protein [Rossellomorea sp. RS05]|uniref:hypothetical protein n=1 Tax=Rossellomorea sp. RS05 TaxID=3149166 RepID=UPI003221CCC5
MDTQEKVLHVWYDLFVGDPYKNGAGEACLWYASLSCGGVAAGWRRKSQVFLLEKDESIFCGNEVERMYIMKVNGII